MPGTLEESTLQASSRVKFTEISSWSPEVAHRFEVACDGGWSIVLQLSKQPADEKPWHLGFFFFPSPSLHQRLQGDNGCRIKVKFSLKYLSGESFKSRSEKDFKRPPGRHDIGSITFADWRQLYCNNRTVRKDNGFLAVLEIDSLPGFEFPSVNPPLLRTISSLCSGDDFVDTKFWVFSRRRAAHGSVGAKYPKQIYANSKLLESQSEYFSTSKHPFICSYNYYPPCEVFHTFMESSLASLDRLAEVEEIDDYDYPSDSDLDADDEDHPPEECAGESLHDNSNKKQDRSGMVEGTDITGTADMVSCSSPGAMVKLLI